MPNTRTATPSAPVTRSTHAAAYPETCTRQAGKPIWAQDPDTKRWVLAADRWHTGFVDAAGTGGLLAQVEGRTSAATIAWLNAQPEPWRAAITHVAVDLSAAYAKAVRQAPPDAVLVVDRFHAVQLGNDMLTQVRQRVIRETQGRRGRMTDRPGPTNAGC